MKVTLKDIQGQDQGDLEVAFELVETGRGTQAVHETVAAHRAAQRSGTASTKTMGEVAGSGKKPWRQKGTGRARAGSFASPLWRGGGVVFGPKPRDFRKRLSKGTRQAALRKALSERLNAGDVMVVTELNLETSKTKEFLAIRKNLGVDGTLLVVLDEPRRNVMLATRNVRGVTVTTSRELNTYQALRTDKLLFTRTAFETLGSRFKD